MQATLKCRCEAEAIAQGFHPDLGLSVMAHYLDEFLSGEPVSDEVFENRFWHNIHEFANSFDNQTDNRLHHVYTEVRNAVKNYLAYVKHTSEESLLSSQGQ